MFLSKHSSSKYKRLAIDLAFLVSVSKNEINPKADKYNILYHDFLGKNEIEKLHMFADYLDEKEYLDSFLPINLDIQTEWNKNQRFQNTANQSSGFSGFEDIFDEMFGEISASRHRHITDDIRYISNRIIENCKDNPQIKQELWNVLNSKNIDIYFLSEKLKQEEISKLPKIKKEIIKKIVESRIKQLGENIDAVTIKSILASLIYIAYSDDLLEQSESDLILFIAEKFNLDLEYIEEFIEPVQKISFATKEVFELINE